MQNKSLSVAVPPKALARPTYPLQPIIVKKIVGITSKTVFIVLVSIVKKTSSKIVIHFLRPRRIFSNCRKEKCEVMGSPYENSFADDQIIITREKIDFG